MREKDLYIPLDQENRGAHYKQIKINLKDKGFPNSPMEISDWDIAVYADYGTMNYCPTRELIYGYREEITERHDILFTLNEEP